jgi:hypothetical protein
MAAADRANTMIEKTHATVSPRRGEDIPQLSPSHLTLGSRHTNSTAAQRLPSATKLLVDQSEARRQEEAKSLAEGDDEFGKQRMPPRLAATDGQRVP